MNPKALRILAIMLAVLSAVLLVALLVPTPLLPYVHGHVVHGHHDSDSRGHNGKDKEGWYFDSPAGVDKSIKGKGKAMPGPGDADKEGWYFDSPAGVDKSFKEKGEAGAKAIPGPGDADKEGWYLNSPAGVGKSLDKPKDIDDEGWYYDSPAGVVTALHEHSGGVEKGQHGQHGHHTTPSEAPDVPSDLRRDQTKESYEISLRTWAYSQMRTAPLRTSAARSSRMFLFTPHPSDDPVDSQHIPTPLRAEFADPSTTDARRVSLLNLYLMVTGRQPRAAAELGFAPTREAPGLVEENEVGYGYAFAGQHQLHCLNFVADAVERGRDGLGDLYLRHVVHCLGLMRANAVRYLMDKREPIGMVRGSGRRVVDGEDPGAA